MLKPLKITIFWPNLCKNGVPMGHTQNKKQFFFFSEMIKPDPKLSKPFYFWTKYHMFWLSYECFSILCNAFLLKSAISSHNSCDIIGSLKQWLHWRNMVISSPTKFCRCINGDFTSFDLPKYHIYYHTTYSIQWPFSVVGLVLLLLKNDARIIAR